MTLWMGVFDPDLNSKSGFSVQTGQRPAAMLDSGFRRNDENRGFSTFYELIIIDLAFGGAPDNMADRKNEKYAQQGDKSPCTP